jgi:hypothetical protein
MPEDDESPPPPPRDENPGREVRDGGTKLKIKVPILKPKP